MSWIADQYILSEAGFGAALRAFRDKPWPPDTWFVIAQTLSSYEGTLPKRLNAWVQLVLQNAPNRQHDFST